MLPKLKEQREKLKEVNANCRWSFSCFIILYNNLKALAELKKKGKKKVGKLHIWEVQEFYEPVRLQN